MLNLILNFLLLSMICFEFKNINIPMHMPVLKRLIISVCNACKSYKNMSCWILSKAQPTLKKREKISALIRNGTVLDCNSSRNYFKWKTKSLELTLNFITSSILAVFPSLTQEWKKLGATLTPNASLVIPVPAFSLFDAITRNVPKSRTKRRCVNTGKDVIILEQLNKFNFNTVSIFTH